MKEWLTSSFKLDDMQHSRKRKYSSFGHIQSIADDTNVHILKLSLQAAYKECEFSQDSMICLPVKIDKWDGTSIRSVLNKVQDAFGICKGTLRCVYKQWLLDDCYSDPPITLGSIIAAESLSQHDVIGPFYIRPLDCCSFNAYSYSVENYPRRYPDGPHFHS